MVPTMHANTTSQIQTVPVLDNGEWIEPDTSSYSDVFNPSSGEVIAQVPECGADEVESAVQSAVAAAADWSETPVVERARVMFRLQGLMREHFDELASLVTREHGKTLAESHAEVTRGIEMVEFACGIPSLIIGDLLPNIATDVDAETVRHPVGVCVGITPFNFPMMVPLWMFPVAITCGNTFVLKPSEKVPLSAVRLGQLMLEAGTPAGVFNIVHGGRECVDRLLQHPSVAAISFVGSTPVARSIYETGTNAGKRVQSAGGAKNHFIIMPDADVDQAVKALAASAYGCAGQRCMASSVAVTVGSAGDPVVETLVDHAGKINVGPSDGNPDVEMGPVIRAAHRDHVASYLEIANQDGATVPLDGRRSFDSDGFLIGPSVVDHVSPQMRIWKEEIFGPVLSVVRADSLDEALAVGQGCEFGNGASIFTRSGYAAQQFKRHFNAGMIGINVGVPAPMAWFPFTGWNRSFFGDLHIQGVEGIHFYTRQKMTLTRWPTSEDSHHDPVWKSTR